MKGRLIASESTVESVTFGLCCLVTFRWVSLSDSLNMLVQKRVRVKLCLKRTELVCTMCQVPAVIESRIKNESWRETYEPSFLTSTHLASYSIA